MRPEKGLFSNSLQGLLLEHTFSDKVSSNFRKLHSVRNLSIVGELGTKSFQLKESKCLPARGVKENKPYFRFPVLITFL